MNKQTKHYPDLSGELVHLIERLGLNQKRFAAIIDEDESNISRAINNFSGMKVQSRITRKVLKAEQIKLLPEEKMFFERYAQWTRDWEDGVIAESWEDYWHHLQETQQRQIERDNNHNLRSGCPDIIGRTKELNQILEGLQSQEPLVLLEGVPGTGKTVLATKAAYCCLGLDEPQFLPSFEFVVWVSAQHQIEPKLWLDTVLNEIADLLKQESILNLPLQQKQSEIDKLLRRDRILIVIDNFETMHDQALEDWIRQVPEPSKVLITSRPGELFNQRVVDLKGLPPTDAFEHIRRVAKNINLEHLANIDSSEEENLLIPLVEVTEGNPKVIEMALGHVKYSGLTLDEVTEHIRQGSKTVNNIFDYIVPWAWDTLSDDAHNLLMVTSFFAKVTQEALAAVSGLEDYTRLSAIKELVRRGLLDMEGELVQRERRYHLHTTVRGFLTTKLEEHQAWQEQARKRWIAYYLDFVERRVRRENIDEPYWRYLGGGRLKSLGDEWQNLQNLLQWIDTNQQDQVLLDLMTRLVHYLDRRAYNTIRLVYARKAAEAAHRLQQPVTEALFRIDALGLTLRKTGQISEAIEEIHEGLELVEQLNQNDRYTIDLKVLGQTFLAKTFVEMRNLEKAEVLLREVFKQEKICIPIIRHRVLVTAGDLAHEEKDYKLAIHYYEEAIEIAYSYSTDGDTDLAGVYRKVGSSYLEIGELDLAERAFEEVISYKGQGGVMNDIEARFGLAQVLTKRSVRLAHESKENLSRLNSGHPLHNKIDRFIERYQ